MKRVLVGIVLLTMVPLAQAAAVDGQLRVEGPIEFDAPTSTRSGALGAFEPDTSSLASLGLTAPSVTVHFFQETFVEAGVLDQHPRVRVDDQRPVWQLHDVTISLGATGKGGWLGLHPTSGLFATSEPQGLTVGVAATATIGNGMSGDDEGQPFYFATTGRPILTASANSWAYAGGGALKLMGPTLVVKSRENQTTIATGEERDASDPTRTTLRWLVLEFGSGSVQAEGAPTDVLAHSTSVSWSGRARLTSATGKLDSALREWSADGPAATLDGDLRANLAPDAQSSAIIMDVSGELQDASLTSRVLLPTSNSTLSWWPLGLIMIGAVLGGAAAMYSVGRKRRGVTAASAAPVLGADEFSHLAGLAADNENYAEAVRWVAQAREHSPTSRRAAIDHAYFVAKNGDVTSALRMLREAPLVDDPDAALLRMMIQVESGDARAAAAAIAEGLDAHPALLFEVESDAELSRLMSDPVVKRAARDARRALERPGPDDHRTL